jgi:hypothetical protein
MAVLVLVFVAAAAAAPPVAVDDTAVVTKNQDVWIYPLDNDTDTDFDSLSISGSTTPANGTADCSSGFACNYVPNPDFVGTDSFDYTVTDGSDSDTGTVTVEVVENQPPVANDDSAAAVKDFPVDIFVLDNDSDPDFGPNSLEVASAAPTAANGTVSCGTFSCTYTPDAGFLGTDSFVYTISDGMETATASVTVNVAENEPPVAEDDEANTPLNTPVDISVLGNDFDSDGLPSSLSITSPSPPAANGTVSCDFFVCTYTPDPGFLGTDTFDYTITDGADSDTGTVTVDVMPPCSPAVCIDNDTVLLAVRPEGHLNVPDGTGSAAGAGPVGLHFIPTGNEATAPGCLCEGWGAADADSAVTGYANVDSDGGAHNMTVESFTSTDSTAVSVVNIEDTLRVTHDYHPSADTPNLYEVTVTIENVSGGPLSDIRYRRVMDWDVEPPPFSEFVTINGGNASQLLFSSNDGFATANPLGGPEDLGFTGDFVDAGPNDHGALFDFGFGGLGAGESTSFNIFYGAAADEIAANAAVAAVGAEVFSYGQPSSSDPAIGTPNTFIFAFGGVGGDPIFAPDAVDDALTTDEDVAGSVNVLANDTDPDGDPLSVTGSTNGAHGTVSCTAAGVCTYTPAANYNGPDSFTYTVSDGNGGTDTATVSVTVQPVAAAGKVKGKGSYKTGSGKPSFVVDASDAGGSFSLTFGRNRFVSTTVESFVRAGNRASFEGAGRWNGSSGYTYQVSFVDNGSPGRNDTIDVVIRNAGGGVVFSSGGPKKLAIGNIVVSG